MGTIASEKSTCTPQSNHRSVRRVSTSNVTKNVESPKTVVDDRGCSSEDVKDRELVAEESSRSKHPTRTFRKREQKGKLGHHASRADKKLEVIHGLLATSPKVQETRTSGQNRWRSRNSTD